ncbi:MAG: thiamine-phosphate kinase [Carboxylicivirga sp.]|jgi:thiamine-monophosphate kinase|nr:thiamine-phosphate kinase [Carboxylicivirga sp.]
MQLKDIGEFGFIQRFATKYDSLIKQGDMGIGDDCAVLSISDTENHVITTDLLVEDVHFLKSEISAIELGHKSLAVNLSDIAAMGAQPLYSFLSVGIPKDTPVEFLDAFMEGYHLLSEKYSVPLMGGDTTKSPDKLVINVAVVGRCKKDETHLRSMAEANDIICVTGPLGDSGAGLKVMLEQLERSDINNQLVKRHHCPEPRIDEGRWLAQQKGVHAMMDISDGISSDLKHILKASGKAAAIQMDILPISLKMNKQASVYNWNRIELAAAGGEDYELLVTIQGDKYDAISQQFLKAFNKPLHPIGRITEGEPSIRWFNESEEIHPDKIGFDHFK